LLLALAANELASGGFAADVALIVVCIPRRYKRVSRIRFAADE
jgi:hypothetical protein